MNKLRVMIADDERPARLFLRAILNDFADVEIVGEAENGAEALEIIKEIKPDLALLDLQMPEATGLDVVRLLPKAQMPLVAFVTAYDEYAIQAFEVNAVDYLLKPIDKNRLRVTLERAYERLGNNDYRQSESKKLKAVSQIYKQQNQSPFIERIPVKHREEIILVPTLELVSIIADGELLHLSTIANKRFTINYRLKDIEAKLNPNKFVRLSRGALANLDFISKINPITGGTYLVILKNGQQIPASRLQSKILRERFLKM